MPREFESGLDIMLAIVLCLLLLLCCRGAGVPFNKQHFSPLSVKWSDELIYLRRR